MSGFTAKFWAFNDVISMVYKSVDHGIMYTVNFIRYHGKFTVELDGKSVQNRTCCDSS